MTRRLLFILIFYIVEASAQKTSTEPYYVITAPRVLRPNSEYHVAVSIHGTSEPTRILVEVGGKQESGGNFQTNQVTTVPPYSTSTVRLEIGDLGPGSYNLTARGSEGLSFSNTTELTYIHKSYSVFIQTDKAIYKPGEKIMFRAVVLNAHLKPTVTGALDIYITDGKNNRVKQWNRALTTKGVFSGELQLSEHPVLGDWKITINILDQMFEKTVTVAEYVLPKFEVLIDTPKQTTFKDGKILATIRAKYTYGKPVKGEATVTVFPNIYSRYIQPVFETPIRKVIPIDGKATVDFDIKEDLKLADEYERMIEIQVTVEEALTGRRQNNSAEITIFKHKYVMELIKTAECFKPGLKYTAYLKLAYRDGTPVQDDKNPVIVKHGFNYDVENYTTTRYTLPKNGIIELEYYVNDPNATTIGIEATYLNLTEWFSTINPSQSPSNTFIQAIQLTKNPKVNEDVDIQINSTKPLEYFNYEIIGRGDVVTANTIRLSEPSKTYRFRFLATYAMAPTARVIVHYVTNDGEVVADALDVTIEGFMQNFVNIDATPDTVEPGKTVQLSIQSKPNSYVGVLGVDQSVLLLKKGNDLSHDEVLNELHSYDPGHVSPWNHRFHNDNIRFKRMIAWWPGSATAQKVFENSGTVVLSNALVYEHSPFSEKPSRAENRARNRPILDDMIHKVKPDLGPAIPFQSRFRPRLEGPYAFSRYPAPVWQHPRVFLMHDIASPWLFSNVTSGYDGRAILKSQIPDTITSWVITGFSVDPIYGLGIIDAPKKVTVFRPFFVSINLPYSVIRGEVVSIPIVVFNYMNKDVTADVTLENTGEFEFTDISNEIQDTPALETFRKKTLLVPSNNGASTSFLITPRKLGYITIRVTARSPTAGDIVDKKLLVKAEGDTQYVNKAIFVDLRNQPNFKTNISLEFPNNFVAGSERITASAVGDLLGPMIPNLDRLIRMPFGCGEQNMLNFVPNIVIMDYLLYARQLTPAVQSKATRFLDKGYQQELTYQRDDGSFSAFGKSDPNGSTWLTAFVAKSFRQATPYINIEERIIKDALHWLESNQATNGSFPEVGHVSHTDMQGGASKGIALTAFTLIAFLENQKVTPIYKNTINKAVDYLVRNLNDLNDTYAIAICGYALHLADHPAKNQAFNLLETKAESKDFMKWWNKPEENTKNPFNLLPNSVSVEMTAYAMLTYLHRGLIQDALPIMRWLISQRNEQGGFASTQDTVIGIQALAKMAEQIGSGKVDMRVAFSYNSSGSLAQTEVYIDQQNAAILQQNELSKKIRNIEITASGSGFAVIQISYSYNVNVTGEFPLFRLDPQVDKISDKNHLQLSICSGFVGTKESNDSNMAVMEVTLPSGFVVDRDSLPSLSVSQNVKRVETKNGDSVVMLYFDKMTRQEDYCPTISAYRVHKIANQKPVPVVLYDYYDQTRKARSFYEAPATTLCDAADENDKACTSERRSFSGNQRSDFIQSAASITNYQSVLIIFAIFYIFNSLTVP